VPDLCVAEGLTVEGLVKAEDNLRVDGRVSGQIEATGRVLIGSNARCTAGIRAQSCDVHGELIGDIACSEVIRIGPGARVVGDLHAPKIEIGSEALVDGRVELGPPSPDQALRPRRIARLRTGAARRPRPPIDPVVESATLSSLDK